MPTQPDNQEQAKRPLFKRLRATMFPVQPGDSPSVKLMKHSAFYLFGVMALMVSAVVGVAIMFVL